MSHRRLLTLTACYFIVTVFFKGQAGLCKSTFRGKSTPCGIIRVCVEIAVLAVGSTMVCRRIGINWKIVSTYVHCVIGAGGWRGGRQWDCRMIPVRPGQADVVVSDLPFGVRCQMSHTFSSKKKADRDRSLHHWVAAEVR
eukprot:1184258-Prorocentrum_minimum.AAC.1